VRRSTDQIRSKRYDGNSSSVHCERLEREETNMNRLHFMAIVVATVAITVSPGPGAQAGTKVGDTTTVERDVSGSLSGEERKLTRGDDVFLNELIRTGTGSAAKLLFVDRTNLAIGPLAAVKLDRFVFNPNQTVKSMAVTITKGAMRWVSGGSPSSAYQIKTPQAIIGVRGTIFDLVAESRRTTVVLQEGSIEVCTTGARRQCKLLSRKGDVLTVTGSTIDGPHGGGPAPSEFASRCLGASTQNCTLSAPVNPPPMAAPKTRKAQMTAPPPQPRPMRVAKKQVPEQLPYRRVVSAEAMVEEVVVPVRRYPAVDNYRGAYGGYPRFYSPRIYRPRGVYSPPIYRPRGVYYGIRGWNHHAMGHRHIGPTRTSMGIGSLGGGYSLGRHGFMR
jgi:hypothetical protein